MLFHDMRMDCGPMLDLLIAKLHLPKRAAITDMGYEVCFFRDAAFRGLIERYLKLEKQTFDLTLVLNNQHMVLIEAKAQQPFASKQLENLLLAKSEIEGGKLWGSETVNLVALYSSLYRPRATTLEGFCATIKWDEIAEVYSGNQDTYLRANALYAEKPQYLLPEA